MSRLSLRSPFLFVLLALAMLATAIGVAPTARAVGTCLDNRGGFDIDGGGTDVVLGLPSYDVSTDGGKVTDAGAVVVYSNVMVNGKLQKPRSTRVYTAAQFGLPVQSGARFGAAVLGVQGLEPDFEGCGHLLVGAPGQTADGLTGAGAVHMLDGWDDGLRLTWSADQSDLPEGAGPPQDRAGFGSRLGGMSIHRIAVGAPGRDVGGQSDAGGVATLQYNDKEGRGDLVDWLPGRSAGDELGSGPLAWAEADDRAILAAGVPGADVGGAQDAGAVAVTQWQDGGQPSTAWMSQDSPGAAGAAEPGDQYGSALALSVASDFSTTVAVGAPGESVGTLTNAGMVSYLGIPAAQPQTPTGLAATLTQSSDHVPGTVERDDRFGASLATGRLGEAGVRQLAVGADGEAIGTVKQAGAVTFNPVSPQLLPTAAGSSWDQGKANVPGTAETGDRFGSTATSYALTIVTSPGEDMGSVPDAGRATFGRFGSAGTALDLVVPGPQPRAGTGMVAAGFVTTH